MRGGKLFLRPSLPERWPGYEARWELSGGTLDISVRRGETPGCTLDGAPIPGGVPLPALQGPHRLECII